MDKITARKYLANVIDLRKQFSLSTGAKLESLYDLDEVLGVMHMDVYSHHVNSSRNDFASWIEKVIGDKELAAKIELVKDKKKIHKLISARVKELEKTIKASEKQKIEDKIELEDIKEGLAESNIHTNKVLKKMRDHRIKKQRPQKHEYMRGHHEHIHYGVWDFLYGLVCGIFLTLIVLRVLGYLY